MPDRSRIFLTLCAATCLSGCLDDAVPFAGTADYRIEGMERYDDAEKYMREIIDDRIAQLQEAGDGRGRARREGYAEETIRSDLVKVLRARGYYNAEITYQDNPAKSLSGTYTAQPGELYHIGSISIQPSAFESMADKLPIHKGDPLVAETVLLTQAEIYRKAQMDSCYFSLKVEHGVVLNERARTGALTYHLEAGPPANFGAVRFEGQENVKVSYLEKLIPWKYGSCFRQDKIENLRTRLMESGLFSRAEVVFPEQPDETGKVALTIRLKERAPRTVRAGLSYYTDEGLGTTLGWQHRNFFGEAEKLDTQLTLSQLRQELSADFLKPYFLRKDQSLSLSTSLKRQDTDAFKETGIDVGGAINRTFNKRLSGSLGSKFTLTRIEDENGIKNNYGLVSTPASLTFDNRDDKLNPTRGWNISLAASPFFDVLGESNPFVKTQLGVSTYVGMGTPADLVLAMRGGVGSILGASTEGLPATERFYAGGGGTVRGFGYQEVGPKEDGTPTGGRSLITGSAELRFKVTDKIGGVTFVDAGSVSDAALPDFDSMAIGAGAGLRYYTGFGPLRFDVAVPLSQKEDLEQKYQIYISIGQAF